MSVCFDGQNSNALVYRLHLAIHIPMPFFLQEPSLFDECDETIPVRMVQPFDIERIHIRRSHLFCQFRLYFAKMVEHRLPVPFFIDTGSRDCVKVKLVKAILAHDITFYLMGNFN
jgi:hypothetical protein